MLPQNCEGGQQLVFRLLQGTHRVGAGCPETCRVKHVQYGNPLSTGALHGLEVAGGGGGFS